MNFSLARAFAAVWAVIFAALHASWAAGATGRQPVAAEPLRGAEGLLAYNVVVAVFCLLAAVVALWAPRRFLIMAAVAFGIRGLLGVGVVVQALTNGSALTAFDWVGPLFLIAVPLFAVAAGRRRRSALDRDEKIPIDR